MGPTFLVQSEWHGLIAAYLFLGGLGGGVMALAAIADLFLQKNDADADRRPAIFAGIAGMAALALGSIFLVLDLEQPIKAIYALSNPRSWITWGVAFISLYFAAGILYVLPYVMQKRVASDLQRFMGVAATVLGFLVSLYTGFLLSSATGITFWNTPALPILFVVSGFSTGAALLMLYLASIKGRFVTTVLHWLEQIDLGLVALELVILFAFFNLAWSGNQSAKEAARSLVGSMSFLIGVPVAGLLLPLALEAIGLRKHSGTLTAVASFFVLMGGALLRVFVLNAGYWAFPWPR